MINGAAVDDKSGTSVSAAGDVNNDGLMDILVAVHEGSATIYLNQGNMRFKNSQTEGKTNPFADRNMAAILGDIDNDGDVDDSDRFLHKRRKAISKAQSKEID